MVKFPESTDETLPYTGVMMVMEENGLAFKGKSFPGLIWCLVNKEEKANLIRQLIQIQQKWDKDRREREMPVMS